jgi:hypothetical protein
VPRIRSQLNPDSIHGAVPTTVPKIILSELSQRHCQHKRRLVDPASFDCVIPLGLTHERAAADLGISVPKEV